MNWADSDDEAMAIARDQWRNGLVTPPRAWDIEQPEDFDREAGEVDDEALRRAVIVAHDAGELAERVAGLVRIGFNRVYLHHVGQDQSGFLAAAEAEILPRLRERA